MLPVNDPILGLLSSKSFIDGLFYIAEKCQEFERKQEYTDNGGKMLMNAYRLYELGEITKAELIKVIELLPETQKVSATRINDIMQRITID